VPFADHGVQRLEPDQPAGHAVQRVARAARVHPAESDVDLASGQGGQGGRQVTGPTELNVQLGGALEGLSNGAQGRVQMTPHVNPKRAFLVSRRRRRQVAGGQQASGRGKEPAARFRQRDPGGAPGQQPYVQFGFQPRHALGQSLLTHGQRGRSTTEMPLVGHRDERPHPRQIKVHSQPPRSTTYGCRTGAMAVGFPCDAAMCCQREERRRHLMKAQLTAREET
jgi:hypothetical protein